MDISTDSALRNQATVRAGSAGSTCISWNLEGWAGAKSLSTHLTHLGVSENVVSTPLYPMVLLIIIPIKWLFHWEYTQHFQTNPFRSHLDTYLLVSHDEHMLGGDDPLIHPRCSRKISQDLARSTFLRDTSSHFWMVKSTACFCPLLNPHVQLVWFLLLTSSS